MRSLIMTQFPSDISVGIVAHNARDRLSRTLESLKKAGCPPERILVVDVASTDGTADQVEQEWPGVRIERLPYNNGPNPARNLAILRAETPYVLLLDDDVELEPNTVPLLKSAMDRDPSIGIGSPVIVYADQPDIIQYAGTSIHFLCESVNLWQGRSVHERGDEIMDIGCASGGTLLFLREAAISVGLFDERYFFGKTDGDFTHRIRVAGYKIIEVPQARVLHHKRKRGTIRYYYQLRNRWHFMLKNYELRTLVSLIPILAIHETLQLALLIVKGHGRTYLEAVQGLGRMTSDLSDDRTKVAKFRDKKDSELLLSGPLVMPEELLANPFMRFCKDAYDTLLDRYWAVVSRTVLR